jgi:hypothetical protein
MPIYMTTRNLRIVAGVLIFAGTLYAVIAAVCIVRQDSNRALIAFLACNMALALSYSAWWKSCNQAHSVPRWLSASCFVLACCLFLATSFR